MKAGLDLIKDIETSSWRNEYIPAVLLMVQVEEPFGIIEANDEYFELLGYTREEVRSKYQNSGFLTLHPEDYPLVKQSFDYQLSNNPKQSFSLTCRLVNKTYGYKTVHFSGRLGSTTIGEKILYIVVTDISQYIETVYALEKEQEFMQLVTDFTDNSFFDYDIKTKTMHYSRDFSNRLGIAQVIYNYPQSIIEMGLIGQENLMLFQERYLRSDTVVVEEELNFTTLKGEELYYTYNYKFIRDESGNPTRVVGKMTDITKHRKQINELEKQVYLDELTGVLSKNITQKTIEEYLKQSKQGHMMHAMIMIDLDNFKPVNDTLGHAVGDAVLKDVGSKLKNLFREDDIVGRVGGDEFFVLLKDFKSNDVLYKKLLGICQVLKEEYKNEIDAVTVSASVGAAVFPQDGTTFDELYRKADSALYEAKARGRDRFALYFNECYIA